MNISTVRASPEIKVRFEKTVHELGFSSMAHFFTRSMESLLEQVEAGGELAWPLRFEEKEPALEPKKKPRRKKRGAT